MASVDKLSIRGVRSFSPERECVIKFYKPLTVIYGMNGCGKTTIIECLKYSCTGSLPPGSRSGQSFVHDPKLADLSEVKAQIKLRFQNRAGIPTTVIRSLQLTQLKKSMRFKALDAVVRGVRVCNIVHEQNNTNTHTGTDNSQRTETFLDTAMCGSRQHDTSAHGCEESSVGQCHFLSSGRFQLASSGGYSVEEEV